MKDTCKEKEKDWEMEKKAEEEERNARRDGESGGRMMKHASADKSHPHNILQCQSE